MPFRRSARVAFSTAASRTYVANGVSPRARSTIDSSSGLMRTIRGTPCFSSGGFGFGPRLPTERRLHGKGAHRKQ